MILQGDALEELRKLPDKCCSVCVTSPPYYNARDYGVADQLGTESSPEEYTCKLVEIFREVARVLKDDGTLWLNIGDSYARHIEDGGIKRKEASEYVRISDGECNYSSIQCANVFG